MSFANLVVCYCEMNISCCAPCIGREFLGSRVLRQFSCAIADDSNLISCNFPYCRFFLSDRVSDGVRGCASTDKSVVVSCLWLLVTISRGIFLHLAGRAFCFACACACACVSCFSVGYISCWKRWSQFWHYCHLCIWHLVVGICSLAPGGCKFSSVFFSWYTWRSFTFGEPLLTVPFWANRSADLFGLTHSLSVKLFGQALLNLLFQVILFLDLNHFLVDINQSLLSGIN